MFSFTLWPFNQSPEQKLYSEFSDYWEWRVENGSDPEILSKVVHIPKRSSPLSKGVERDTEGRVYMLMKDHFARGSQKVISTALELTTNTRAAHATVTIKDPQDEIDILREINAHQILLGPRFVKLHHHVKYVAKDKNFRYGLMMELCDMDLFTYVVKNLKSPERFVIFEDCCEALAICEEKGVHHRDIKLENIFILNGRAKLGDLGMVTTIEEEKQNPRCCGSPPYVAPEVMVEKRVHLTTDIWSMGVVLHVLRAGALPSWQPKFNAADPPLFYEKSLLHNVTNLTQEEVDKSFKNVLQGSLAALNHAMFALDPLKRIRAKELLQAVRHLRNSGSSFE